MVTAMPAGAVIPVRDGYSNGRGRQMLNPDDLHERSCKGLIHPRDIKHPGCLVNSREAMAVMREIMDYIEILRWTRPAIR